MTENIIKTCNKINEAADHYSDLTNEEVLVLEYMNMDLAKAIIQDLDSHNAESIAKIILGYLLPNLQHSKTYT